MQLLFYEVLSSISTIFPLYFHIHTILISEFGGEGVYNLTDIFHQDTFSRSQKVFPDIHWSVLIKRWKKRNWDR